VEYQIKGIEERETGKGRVCRSRTYLREILTRMRTAGFFARGCGDDGLEGAL
jgi:hypothetical protein